MVPSLWPITSTCASASASAYSMMICPGERRVVRTAYKLHGSTKGNGCMDDGMVIRLFSSAMEAAVALVKVADAPRRRRCPANSG
jgi:hypothetical protein